MSFLKSWKNEILLLAVAALYAACCWLASLSIGQQDRFHGLMYIGNAALFTEVLFYLFIIVYGFYLFALLFIHKPAHPLAFLKTRVLAGPLNRERLLRALPVLIAFIVVFSVFTSMKFMIAAFQPYGWDETFLHLDRIIHFGHDPWRLLMPFLGYAPVTWAVNLIYNLWLPILFAVLYWQLFSLKHPQARMQFFLAFTLTWAINGTLLAILFSSVGPCFLERLDGNAYYLPMMDYLHAQKKPQMLAGICPFSVGHYGGIRPSGLALRQRWVYSHTDNTGDLDRLRLRLAPYRERPRCP